MIVYCTEIAICIILGLISNLSQVPKKHKKIIFCVIFLTFTVVSAFRYDVGRDFEDTYIYTFNRIKNNYSNVRIDIGLYMIIKLIIFLNGNQQWLFIITSFIINYFIFKTIFRNSQNKMLSIYIYICGTLYFFSMNGIRQTIAIALFYYSLQYIENRKFKKYLFLNIIGILFHNSAIIFIPLYFVLNKKLKFKTKVAILLIVFLSINVLVPIINKILLNTKYAMYLTNGAYTSLSQLNVSTFINILIWSLYNISKTNDSKSTIYGNIHFCGIIVTLFLLKVPLAMRIFMPFRYIEFLSVPYLIETKLKNNKIKTLVEFSVMIVYLMYFIHGVYIENGNDVLPYQTFL